jgi:rhodanese-related sulfurtransferase
MKKIVFHIILLLSLASCSFGQKSEAPATGITNPEYKKTVDSYLNFKVPTTTVDILSTLKRPHVILDARERDEYDVSHIPGALYLGYDKPQYDILEDIEKDELIIIYCSIGYRSEKLGQKLKKKGYNKVLNLYGSIFEWANRDFPLYNNQDQVVKKIHGYNKKWSQWVDNVGLEVTY